MNGVGGWIAEGELAEALQSRQRRETKGYNRHEQFGRLNFVAPR